MKPLRFLGRGVDGKISVYIHTLTISLYRRLAKQELSELYSVEAPVLELKEKCQLILSGYWVRSGLRHSVILLQCYREASC